MINVTQTFLPPQEEYQAILKRAWDAVWLTNRGQLVKELELKLQNYLCSVPLLATTNGTLPLQIALKVLAKQGEVITTPFSYVATTSSIVWEHCTPVFVDIDPEYLTIDETKIEAAITSKTTAILATHVFGNPCAVEEIEQIAQKHQLAVIYDAAHGFGVNYKGKSLFNYGDVSTCSFHATKLFHTGEGGALFCKNEQLMQQCFYHHNFGHQGPEAFQGIGINAKMSELQAAMGLAVLPYMKEIITKRQVVVNTYDDQLKFRDFKKLRIREGTEWNYSYYPIIFEEENKLVKVKEALLEEGINPRRYFYPSLHQLPYVAQVEVPVSESISKRILCLPLSSELSTAHTNLIIQIINQQLV
ncbi:DegT/DnrJ/EryC1/StrS family aminotransferase [Mesonia mobilis]|uniref:Aminotransferase DegT n=1 Tax=Mesonia mobilis TaxID=369791 RepID=A0ABQ3BPG8_9FLAO|nr:DegT/DnrJ/EryC1/StrS family aminotransferase [Mesonia mobilis]MBQ0737715.1 DegT/DnrJ/EryC1/StrS family aminotransferase [Aquimarina celericrescens]GGZ53438.1 aminotransferase DegT [Mesonia mobilis]